MNHSIIKLFDFSWMRQGLHLKPLTQDESALLHPFEIEQQAGNNRALFLIHGFASSPAVFRYLLPGLKHYQFISATCLPGHGTSIQEFSKSSFNVWLDHAANSLEKLSSQYEKVDVLGLSLGGLIACHLSQQFSISHLYLLAPALGVKGNLPMLLHTAKLAKKLGFFSIYNRGGQILASNERELSYRQLPLNPIIEILESIQAYQSVRWTHPTTLFLGQHDLVVDNLAIENKLKHLPKLETHILKNSGHVLPLENEHQLIIEIMKQKF